MEIYDRIGTSYNKTRKADLHIASLSEENLCLKLERASLLDVGAGTGNYSHFFSSKGHHVTAVEPSGIMMAQAAENTNIKWIKGSAEEIPLPTSSFDGIISILASHHFNDLEKAILEMNRILKPKHFAVIFAGDPSIVSKQSWLFDYFQIVFEKSVSTYLPIHDFKSMIERVTKANVKIIDYLLPDHLTDYFFASAWKNPTLYLNETFRAGISPLASLETSTLNQILERLENDLKNGIWLKKYGNILEEDFFDGGYRFLVWQKN
ncbi:class I SAM-dependent methyltransferase [Leptospira brenneri]|uniref:class I SAM-dependent methyltransferase n=1 Tax=Leptospira brenneri TaxID=2023182 RepID=UPI000C2A8C62|nr:class I SAM-dependent methyltransferase [Leptospira brenneri]PJZ43901.1 ubiquinone biosynthesis methyltransferase UbiE [Leptospira brenneri]